MDCRFNKTREMAMRNSSSPLYKGNLICDENLSITFLKKRAVKMSQCWAVGFAILEISKYFMQRSWYEEILPRLGGWRKCTMILSDTDSFIFQVRGEHTTDILKKLSPIMDFSNFDMSHPLFDATRAKQLGFFKSELPSARIREVVALKSKTYAISSTPMDVFNLEGQEILRRAKGVSSNVRDSIPFEDFRRCVQEIQSVTVNQFNIRSVRHKNMLVKMHKLAFSSFDDKRYLMCNVHSVPYGSALIFLWKNKASFPKDENCPFCFAENPAGDLLFLFQGVTQHGDTFVSTECDNCSRCDCDCCYVCWERRSGRCPLCGKTGELVTNGRPTASVYAPESICIALPHPPGITAHATYQLLRNRDGNLCNCREPNWCPIQLDRGVRRNEEERNKKPQMGRSRPLKGGSLK